MAKRKIVLFGGTFDPVHLGHTAVAGAAAEHIGAEKIILIPAKRSPLKDFLPVASEQDRFAMLALAVADDKKFWLSDYELKSSGPCYTLETVRHFQAKYGSNTELYWLIGADTVDELQRWYKITGLIDECNLCVMFRAGCKRPNFAEFEALWGRQRIEKLQQNIIETPLIDISGTEIRSRLAAGGDAADMLHPKVADYIRRHRLYKSKAES